MSEWHDVLAWDGLAADEPAAVVAGGVDIVLVRHGGEVFALNDLCTHGRARLSEGFVTDGCIECPLHQGLFDLRTGAPRSTPVTKAVRVYGVRQVGGRLEVEV